MKILCVLGKHNYGNPLRGEGYEYVNFLPALRNLGHEVVHFESYDRAAYSDFADLNRKFLQTVQREVPDIILTVLVGYEIWLETLELIRESTRAVLINWATDDSWKYVQFSRWVSQPFHIYVTTSLAALKQAQAEMLENFVLSQWGAPQKLLQPPKKAGQCQYDVSFVGTAYGNRKRWVDHLGKNGIRVSCFGYGWPAGAVKKEAVPEIIRDSILTLNFGDSGIHFKYFWPYRSRQIKARIFEVPGLGGCLLTEDAPELETYFKPGSEIVVYRNQQELLEKIKYFLQHNDERDRLAQAAYARVVAEHTYEQRFTPLLEQASIMAAQRAQQEFMIDFAKFEEIAAKHLLSPGLKMLKLILVVPCVLLWGRKRGPRAARRILHELSWRIAGRKTYKACGWPGRLFYKES